MASNSNTPPTGLTARVIRPGAAVLTTDHGERTFTAATTKAAINDLLSHVAGEIANPDQPTRVQTYDEAGNQVPLLVHHDGTIRQASSGGPVDDPAGRTEPRPDTSSSAQPTPPAPPQPSTPDPATDTSPTAEAPVPVSVPDAPAPIALRQPATAEIHRPRPVAPKLGVQGLIYRATKLNVGLSGRERKHNQLVARIRTPLPTQHRCAFISLKGGIGKTTSAAGFGHTFAHYRPDSVFVADMNPDAGTLAKRTIGAPLAGVKPLLAAIQAGQVNSLTDLSRYTRAAGRLTVLPGDPDPQAGQAMDADDFRTVMDVVQRYYSLILIDTGDGVTRPITPGILDGVDSVVVAATHSKDGAEAAIETLDWLAGHGYERLAKSAVVTLSAKDRVSKEIDKAAVAKILDARAAALITIPPDSHLADAGAIDRDRLAPATRRVLMEGAAAVAGHWADIDHHPDR